MPFHKELYLEIEELVIENELKDALLKLKAEFEGLGRFELIDTTIILLNRLSSFNLRVLQEIEPPAVAEQNKLVLGVLNLLSELKNLHRSLNVLEDSKVVAEGYAETGGIAPEIAVGKKTKILFSSANPSGTTKLDIEKEALAIQFELDNSDHRQKFETEFIFKTVPELLVDNLLKFRPNIFHFAGHAVEDVAGFVPSKRNSFNPDSHDPAKNDVKNMGMVFEDANGGMKVIKGEDFASLISVQRDSIECVVLNTQYSRNVAQEIAGIVDFAIGVDGVILDLSAYYFTQGFYKAIASGQDIPDAFKIGQSLVRFNTGGEESEKYFLFSTKG